MNESISHARLAELESIIERHLIGFERVGMALIEIRDQGLYKKSHDSFEGWARDRFNFSRQRAYQLINATRVRKRIIDGGTNKQPTNEYQIRGLASLPEEIQHDVWEDAVAISGEEEVTDKHVRAAVREHKRGERIKALREISKGDKPLHGTGRYPVVLADPPWQYASATVDPSRQIENQYPTMDMESICALPVAEELATDDAVLFLWATSPLLQDALAVLESWGFAYKTHAVWDKMKFGMGYWLRGQHELLLIGVRGNPPKPAPGERRSSMITAPRREHSTKPAEAYEMVEAYYPDLPKVEMFARGNNRPGWSAWGNQS